MLIVDYIDVNGHTVKGAHLDFPSSKEAIEYLKEVELAQKVTSIKNKDEFSEYKYIPKEGIDCEEDTTH